MQQKGGPQGRKEEERMMHHHLKNFFSPKREPLLPLPLPVLEEEEDSRIRDAQLFWTVTHF